MKSQLQIRGPSEIGLAIGLRMLRIGEEERAKPKKSNGRPVGTRTPDLYRVKVAL